MKRFSWNSYLNEVLAREVSSLSKYYDEFIYYKPRLDDSKEIFDLIKNPNKIISDQFDFASNGFKRSILFIKGLFNHDFDIQKILMDLHPKFNRTSRIVLISYNPYLSFIYKLANIFKFRKSELPSTFITNIDLVNIAKLGGFEVVRVRPVGHIPFKMFGIGDLLNYIMPALPGLRWLSLGNVIILKPITKESSIKPSLSIIIPARNEKGNIENAIKRLPNLQCKVEVIFVEGNSTDNTWEEIVRVSEKYKTKVDIKYFKQPGKGKGDAVRLGFEKATLDLVTILDADLTMPPELLGRFYNVFSEGLADFVNGTRLVYPMEGEAMRFLNRLGNIFFAKALSFVLDVKLADSLCGTKLLLKKDYERFIAWRNDFGDFDPFGDFELLFPAAIMGLGIVDVPIRYLARTYGTTNIHRFRHGFMLLKMTSIGFFKVKCRK